MRWHYTVAAHSDAGTTKAVNQDSMTVKVANTICGEAALAVMCDGMGGLEQGEVASATVAHAYEQWFLRDLPQFLAKGFSETLLKEVWYQLANECNVVVANCSKEQKAPMGTTLTALLLLEGRYYISHVGDCRVYVMGNGMEQLTADQTYVAREVALGHMTPDQARTDARRNVLLQSIGTVKNVNPDFVKGDFYDDDTFLVCSDGFRHKLTDAEIYDYCHTAFEGMEWYTANRLNNSHFMNGRLRYLMENIKARGERDNISAIILKATNATE